MERKKKISAAEYSKQNPGYRPVVMLKEFLQLEASGGIILVFCAIIAMIIANSPLSHLYHEVLHETKAVVGVGPLVLEKDIIHWINDGLMAIFFFLVGLEIKREFLEGALKGKKVITPMIAAIGGIVVPALIYVGLNQGHPDHMVGWATPTATDIAFAVGVISLLGTRVPIALKVFLLALAIIDDLAAIIIIALFYTANLNMTTLALGGFFIAGLALLNYFAVNKGSLYVMLGVCLWICVLKSGVHATLAGVITALAIPLNIAGERRSLLRQLEHDLHSFVAFVVLPLFALANAGISLDGISLSNLFDSVTLGVILGLFLGKQIGITLFTWVFCKLGISTLAEGLRISQIWAVSILGGIGFTMSIFIATLGFIGPENATYLAEAKLGIIIGSVISALAGLLVLHISCPKSEKHDLKKEEEALMEEV